MFLDIGWSELLVIGVVALVVIGPKDLPKALRTAGILFRKARNISREFQSSVEQMVREAELDDVRKEIEKAGSLDLDKEFRNTIDPDGTLAQAVEPPKLPDFSESGESKPGETAAAAEPTPEPAAPLPEPVSPAPAPAATPEPSGEAETPQRTEPAPGIPAAKGAS